MRSVTQDSDRNDEITRTIAFMVGMHALYRPPSRLPMSDWADRYRILSSESSAEPGQWITAKAPYEREIMNAISDPFTPKVCVQKAAQVGITDSAILNSIGYFMDEDPCPMLVVQPTIEMAEAFSTDRLAPMLRDSPRLQRIVADPRARDSTNTLRRKSFRGGYIAMGGANSAASLSGRPVRVALFDDVDRYPASAGTEGNPLQLGIARTSAFWNRKVVIVSSPGIKGVSHIEREMDQSTCEHWNLPCAMCGFLQVLDWNRIRFDDMTHRCVECGEHTPKYLWLAGDGEWRALRPFDEKGNPVTTRGFYLSGLYNPWVEWEILYDEYVRATAAEAEGDVEPLKAFMNTRLGLLHEDTGQKVDIDLFATRREIYHADEPTRTCDVPAGVLVLTGGIDVHERQINYEIVGWGKGRESWGIEYGMIDGDPREADVWLLLDKYVLNRVLVTHDGKFMRLRKMAVDSGYAADFVYAYTKPRQPRAIAIKGEGGLGKPLIKSSATLTKSNQARLVILGVDTGKEEIVNRLLVTTRGPGFCHFPRSKKKLADKTFEAVRGYDEEYFKGLTAERRIVKAKHGFRTYLWMKRLSQRNEPFDCRNYALAALSLPYSGINLDKMKRDLYVPPADEPPIVTRFGAQAGASNEFITSSQPAPGTGKFGAQNRPMT